MLRFVRSALQRRTHFSQGPFRGHLPAVVNPNAHVEAPPRPVQWYGAACVSARNPTSREERVAKLALDTFGEGIGFLKTVISLESLPEGVCSFPEVCFAGHTNAGKSALIGALGCNKRLGRDEKTAGSTNLLKFFNVGDALLLCDMPGYGVWEGRDSVADAMLGQALVKQYIALRHGRNLKRVYLVIAAHLGVRRRDREFAAFLRAARVPFTIVLSQIDRVGSAPGSWVAAGERVLKALRPYNTGLADGEECPMVEVSAARRWNMDSLMNDIVYNASADLAEDRLTLADLRRVSFAPTPALVQLAVEAVLPPQGELLPEDDSLPLAAAPRAFHKMLRSYAAPQLVGSGALPRDMLTHSMGSLTASNADALPQSYPGLPASALAFSTAQQLAPGGGASTVGSTTTNSVDSTALALATSTSGDVQPATAAAASAKAASGAMASAVTSATCFTNVMGVRIPAAAVPAALGRKMRTIEGSREEYAHAVDSGWIRTLDESNMFFVSKTERDVVNYGRGKKIRLEIKRKYVETRVKVKPMMLHGPGYTCPWIGDGATQPSAVMGHSGARPTSGLMQDLKSRGLGGRSLSKFSRRATDPRPLAAR